VHGPRGLVAAEAITLKISGDDDDDDDDYCMFLPNII